MHNNINSELPKNSNFFDQQDSIQIEKNLDSNNFNINGIQFSSIKRYLTFSSNDIILSSSQKNNFKSSYQLKEEKKIIEELNKMRGGDLGPPSSPGARARNDARCNSQKNIKRSQSRQSGSLFADALSQNYSNRSRSQKLQKFQPHQLKPGHGGFVNRFRRQPTPDPYNPGCASGPKSITVVSSQQEGNLSKNQDVRKIITRDNKKTVLKDKSANHLTSKHGHVVGITDPLPVPSNQKLKKYPSAEIRTRINKKNKQTMGNKIEEILQSPDTKIFSNITMRGIPGHGYFTSNYIYKDNVGFFIGITTDNEFDNIIIKAQPITTRQFKMLETLNKID